MTDILENTVSSMNSIRPSIIFALLGKCRYRAASDNPTSCANLAVVILPPGLDSRMRASACNISGFRLALGMVGLSVEDLGAHTGIRKDFKQ